MAQRNRRQISIATEDYRRLAALRDGLAEKTGTRVTLTDTITRSIDCLSDAYQRGAWLSPREAAPVLEQRHRDKLASVLAQFIARACPEKQLKGIAFDPKNGTMTVHFDEVAPIAVWTGDADAVAATTH